MIPYKQLSLNDIFQDCQNKFENDKPAFLSLLEQHIHLDEIIPVTFYNHFYASTGRTRKYPLKAFLWALIIQRIFSIPTDQLLLVFAELSLYMNKQASGPSVFFCISKKNWQMIDTVSGAKSSAIIYSIAETAKANNLKPYEYFEYLLSVIPEHMDDTDKSFLEDLLPWSANLPERIRKPVK